MHKNSDENNVNRLLHELKREKQYKDRRKSGKDQRVTATLSEHDFRRLRFIARELGTLRSTFIRKVLIEALNDAEKVLNLEVTTNEVDEHTSELAGEVLYEYSEYGKYLYGFPVEDEDEDSDDDDDAGKK